MAEVRSPSPAAVNETVMSGATGCIQRLPSMSHRHITGAPHSAHGNHLHLNQCRHPRRSCMCQALSQRRQALWQGPLEPGLGRAWPAHQLLWSVEQRVQQVNQFAMPALLCAASWRLRSACHLHLRFVPRSCDCGALTHQPLPVACALNVTACQNCAQQFLLAQNFEVFMMSCSCHC